MLSPQCLCAPSIKHCSYYLLPDVKHLGGVDWVQVGAFSGWLVSWQDEKHNSFMCCFFNSLTVCVQMSALIVSCTSGAGGLLHGQDIKRSYFPLKNYDHFTSVSLLNLFLISHFHHGSRFLTSFLLFLNKSFPSLFSLISCSSPSSFSASSATAAVTHLAHQNTRSGSLSRTQTFHVTRIYTQTPGKHAGTHSKAPMSITLFQTGTPWPQTDPTHNLQTHVPLYIQQSATSKNLISNKCNMIRLKYVFELQKMF